ncbi:MAG TPA: hypothetical protein VHO84_05375 [Syntrophorhabdaceae bacterium]|nr:hypothetical protein [Syntrophorhabdaceae bacterium]
MRKVIKSAALIVVLVLVTTCIQGCFTPYPAAGTPERAETDRRLNEEMRSSVAW